MGLEFARPLPDYQDLSPEEKKRCIVGALKARQRFDGQNVFLVDDLMITGYTLKEAARALRAVGANRVYGFVCGRGVTFSDLAEHLTRVD
ncbi:MAG: phosphoribosyltransferase family protein [bacterium]